MHGEAAHVMCVMAARKGKSDSYVKWTIACQQAKVLIRVPLLASNACSNISSQVLLCQGLTTQKPRPAIRIE